MPEARPTSGPPGAPRRNRNKRKADTRRLQAQQRRAAEEAQRRSRCLTECRERWSTPGVSQTNARRARRCEYRCPIDTRASCSSLFSSHRELEEHIVRTHTEKAVKVWKYVSSPERTQAWQALVQVDWAYLDRVAMDSMTDLNSMD